jgi:DNA-binding NtrC family response regulator
MATMGKREAHPPAVDILLVDDERGFADVLRRRLGRRGIRVTTALSGTEGIQKLRDRRFHAAVLDLKMEDMDGIEVLKIFKRMDPHMPVIMLTGHGSEQAARDGMAHGAFDYLTKPCELEELVEKICQAVGRRR